MIHLTIYTRPGCHLCDEMKALVHVVMDGHGGPTELEEVDISTDAGLEARYGLEIPVLKIDGRTVAKHRTTATQVARALAARTEHA